jgi:hypothetical protein
MRNLTDSPLSLASPSQLFARSHHYDFRGPSRPNSDYHNVLADHLDTVPAGEVYHPRLPLFLGKCSLFSTGSQSSFGRLTIFSCLERV